MNNLHFETEIDQIVFARQREWRLSMFGGVDRYKLCCLLVEGIEPHIERSRTALRLLNNIVAGEDSPDPAMKILAIDRARQWLAAEGGG